MSTIVSSLVTSARPVLLLAVASQLEARAIRERLGLDPSPAAASGPRVGDTPWILERVGPGVELVVTGVGKVNAAAAVASSLEPHRHVGVLSLGIAGILPQDGPRPVIGDVVVASAMRYPDEGLETPDGYRSLAQLGFPHGPFDGGLGFAATPDWAATLHQRLGAALARNDSACRVHLGPIATVSTCSGTDALAQQVYSRTEAIAEAMEGAAVCQVAAWRAMKFAEVRVLSNTTGNRASQQWDMKSALSVLGRVAAAVCL